MSLRSAPKPQYLGARALLSGNNNPYERSCAYYNSLGALLIKISMRLPPEYPPTVMPKTNRYLTLLA